MITQKHFYISKKFLGLVFSIDFDLPQGMTKRIAVIELKLLFIGFWITFDEKNK